MFQAYKWFSLARETNSNLPVVAECMTIQQIFEAERLVAEVSASHPVTRFPGYRPPFAFRASAKSQIAKNFSRRY
jgi:hypothetical protein